MDVVDGLAHLTAPHGRLFVVVGVFDGIHRGHAYLLRRLVREAARRDARPTVITFDAHPDEILTGSAPPLLVDPDERLARLARAGVAVTVVQHFDRALRETPFDAFVRMISDRTRLAGFLMTPDAAFGYQRGGTPETLATLGAATEPRFDVAVVPPFELGSHPVRSSEIRQAIGGGDLVTARRLLGRDHAVAGDAEAAGKGPRGGTRVTFGMPVALPPDGDYAVRVGAPIHGAARAAGRMATATVDGATILLPDRTSRRRVRVAFAGTAVGG
jgi:riboflavin kinase/FMN adenylyltransferase